MMLPEPLTRGLSWCLLVGLAFYSAESSAAFLENRLRVAPKPLVSAAPVAVPSEPQAATVPPQGLAKLLATTRPAAAPGTQPGGVTTNPGAPGAPGTGPGAVASNAPPASLKLRGTMAGVGGSGLAMIDVNGETLVVSVGEDVAGMTLAEVNTYSARLEGPGRSHLLEMDVATSLPAAVELPPQTIGQADVIASPTPDATPGVEASPAMGAILTQTELRNILDNPGQFAGNGFRMKPVMRDGEIVGMRVTIRDGSHPLARLGVQNGDIVRSLNGTPLNGPEALSSIYRVLRNTSNLNFDVERGGSQQSVNVTLTE